MIEFIYELSIWYMHKYFDSHQFMKCKLVLPTPPEGYTVLAGPAY
jgi:uncharacterized protein YqgQ